MTVYRKDALLSHHSFCRLRLMHAAFVDSYPVNDRGSSLPVNRLLFVRDDDAKTASVIRDCLNGRLLPMRAGKLYFIPCNHVIDMFLAKDLHFYSLQFNLDIFYGIDLMESCPRCEELHVPELVTEIGSLLEREFELKSVFRVNEIIYGLCIRWTPLAECDVIRDRIAIRRKYGEVLDFICRSADATTTVESLAEIISMRKDVFSRTFSRDIGLSPKDFLSNSLVRKASEMLLSPGSSVGSVAKALNFSSEYYFSHFFKRRTKHSPSEFRRLNGVK